MALSRARAISSKKLSSASKPEAEPATTILPLGWSARPAAEASISGPKSMRVSPPLPNDLSRVPSELYRATPKSWKSSRIVPLIVPATTILPSGWIATATAWFVPVPKSVSTEPLLPKWVSTVPSALNRVRAKSVSKAPLGAKTEAVPATTILPSGPIASPAATSLVGAGTLVTTSPRVPKRVSRVPLVLYRATPKPATVPPSVNVTVPAATILPSDWTTTPAPLLREPAAKLVRTCPPAPNVGSSLPAVV